MKRTLLLAATIFMLCMSMSAQDNTPVRWRAHVQWTDSIHGTIMFRAIIDRGWHLYGLEMPQGGPQATQFDFSESKGIELDLPVRSARAPIEQFDAMFNTTLSWWDSDVTFKVPFTVSASRPMLKVGIRYMVCDGTTCRPPKTVRLSFELSYSAQR